MLDLPLLYSLSLFFIYIVLLQPLLRLLIYVYIYMYTCSFMVHILPPFVDLYIIHYVFIAYSTLNIVSFVYIYILKFICFLSSKFIKFYLFIYF